MKRRANKFGEDSKKAASLRVTYRRNENLNGTGPRSQTRDLPALPCREPGRTEPHIIRFDFRTQVASEAPAAPLHRLVNQGLYRQRRPGTSQNGLDPEWLRFAEWRRSSRLRSPAVEPTPSDVACLNIFALRCILHSDIATRAGALTNLPNPDKVVSTVVGCGRNGGKSRIGIAPALHVNDQEGLMDAAGFQGATPFFNDDPPAIRSLITTRCRVLGLSRMDLIRRTPYKNWPKGLRRLDALLAGDFVTTGDLIRALPLALGLAPKMLERAIEETRRQTVAAETRTRQSRETAWRAAFIPHAIIVTEHAVPQPVFVAALIGIDRLLRIDFDLSRSPVSYVGQAIAGIRCRLDEFGSRADVTTTLPAFGRPVGFIINYTPDGALCFDLSGNALEMLSHAHRLAEVSFTVGGQRY